MVVVVFVVVVVVVVVVVGAMMDDVQVSSQDDWDLSESDRYKFWTDGKNG